MVDNASVYTSGADVTFDKPLRDDVSDAAAFITAWPVRLGDVDSYSRLRLDGVARYLQDAAWEHLQASTLVNTDPTWIVRRTVIDVIRPITWPDDITVRRWCSGMSTRWADMRSRITSRNGGLIETEGFWINISDATGRPTRISDQGLAYLATTATEQRLRWHPWLTDAPARNTVDTDVEFPVRATDIDQYNHVNNTAYWQAAEQYLVDFPKLIAAPHRAVIEYDTPVLAREHITIRSRYDSGDRGSGATLRLWFLVADLPPTTHIHVGPLPS